MGKKRVLLTGATGVMGGAGLQELLARSERYDITLLVRPSHKNRRKMKAYASMESVRIVWGDLCKYEDVARAVEGADYVLHVGGSPDGIVYARLSTKGEVGDPADGYREIDIMTQSIDKFIKGTNK